MLLGFSNGRNRHGRIALGAHAHYGVFGGPCDAPSGRIGERETQIQDWLLCVRYLACTLIGIQTYRNNATQQELHSEITHIQKDTTRIERNTQQPPSVQVTNNIPAPTIALPNRSTSDRRRNAPSLEAQLRSLSNPQLRQRTLAFAHRMAEFARNAMVQVAAYSDSTVKPENPSPAQDKPSQTSADGVEIYNKMFLNEAVAMRAELRRRVGLVGSVYSEQAFAPLPPNADIERISDAAKYLESPANKLPNR